MNKQVAITRCETYEPEAVYRALCLAVEAAGDFDVRAKRVLLKPNIVSDEPPEKAVTTHPVFLEAAIRLVRERGAARIMVGDSPGLQKPGFTGKRSGLGELTLRMGADWVDFTREKAEVPCPDGKAMKQFTITAAVKEVDCIISLPKLKTHQLMYYTGAMKNLFGLIPSVMKSPMHVRFPSREGFAAMIVDLNTAVMPHYALMDAIVGMEGPGPGSGYPRQIGLVLGSSNLLAMDIAASEIIGYPPLEIPVTREALDRGIWLSALPGKLPEIVYPLLAPGELHIPDFEKIPFKKKGGQLTEFLLPRSFRKFRERLTPRPVIDHALCLRCGDCTRICGSKAMTLSGEGSEKRVQINYKVCIRCYCCHEICPVKAIGIKNVPLGEVLLGE
ncbi:iron-sulfur cluster-binding protein [Treponema primitia ZAS-2]|uniref:Iron-sulfur cluster-binding protein n=1 Tax=Treponema primitia (strain ATCC BAA-887 / DSM 12427 / ZAS-2) TaxID=545694 RepID=F5YNB3_TREPZ|nr:DUF362 domain-containing protein [Treponema primitia]AEF83690.1 iron-sulfur cluster-binding protein [Treponema primitia ZAS-2]